MWKRWWLFNATDFQSLMYPCFTVCCILGISPYKFNASTFEASKLRYILSTMIICICCIIDLRLIYYFIYEFKEGVLKILECINFVAFSSFIVIITHILNGPRMRLLQTILKISSKLPPESYQELSRLIHVKDIFGIILLTVQLCLYFYRTQIEHRYELNLNFLIMMFTVYLITLEFQINMLYINCICVLKACFKRINDNVVRMQRLVVNDVKPCVPRLICHMQNNQFLLTELKTLQKQHLMVSDTVQMLNVIFNLQLLATIVMTFSNITFGLYSFVVRWENGLRISFDNELFDVFIISIMLNIIKITLLVWACETGKNQAQEIGATVHSVLNSTKDEQIKNELHLFSLQILHCKNIFSAKGLTVDATFLTTMVGGITTYMLILIQFLIISHSCDKKSGTSITSNSVI